MTAPTALPGLTSLGIIPLLATILDDQFPEGSGPLKKKGEGEIERGTVTSPIARRLYAGCKALAHQAQQVGAEHERLHENPRKVTLYDCEQHNKEIGRIKNRLDAASKLFWRAVEEEHPQVAPNSGIGLREGWTLVSSGEWRDIVPVTDRTSIANTFVTRLAAIVTMTHPPDDLRESGFGPVARGEEVIGTVDDLRLRMISRLDEEICETLRKEFPKSILDALDDLTGRQRRNLSAALEHFGAIKETFLAVWWQGVRESARPITDSKNIGIRADWKIVTVPEESEQEEAGIEHDVVMTAQGPVIRLKIPVPSELREAFRKLAEEGR